MEPALLALIQSAGESPAARRVNREKADRLPTSNLLKRREDTILSYWDAMQQTNPVRFEKEAVTFAGTRQLNLA